MNVNVVSVSGVVDDDPALMREVSGREHLDFAVRVDGHGDEAGVGSSNYVRCRVDDDRAAGLERRISRGCLVALSGEMRQPYRINAGRDGPEPPAYVVVGEIDVLSAPCSGSTLADVVGLGWRGDAG